MSAPSPHASSTGSSQASSVQSALSSLYTPSSHSIKPKLLLPPRAQPVHGAWNALPVPAASASTFEPVVASASSTVAIADAIAPACRLSSMSTEDGSCSRRRTSGCTTRSQTREGAYPGGGGPSSLPSSCRRPSVCVRTKTFPRRSSGARGYATRAIPCCLRPPKTASLSARARRPRSSARRKRRNLRLGCPS